jgi:uncharacterized protein (TIGR03435 family)
MKFPLRCATIITLVCVCAAAFPQTADPVARVFHPAPPLPSYDVATIKPVDLAGSTTLNGMRFFRGTTIREFIRTAYSPTFAQLAPSQVIGGPEWIDKDEYIITSKPPADLEIAMKKMRADERTPQEHSMQQSLLAERFHLKVHFEVREMPVYTLVPAKGGLKIKQVDAPAPREPGSPPPPPPSAKGPLPPGVMMTTITNGGALTVRARATTITGLLRLISSQLGETGNRPIIDRTGFTGFFDIDELKWASLTSANSEPSDLPTLPTALEESLGIKLVATKGPVEVVVIDSIDHPSEN